eukprot:TRINITY_DN5295_c1_g2_i4.p4 TRINITY_DN5295_c1_g2~~TRINITY_DN5295_c1_g2_i4.p4  ORF type:complete len:100 (+),score=10.35 TRINITY_DN5295_c1_g2_i4:64-363(+)
MTTCLEQPLPQDLDLYSPIPCSDHKIDVANCCRCAEQCSHRRTTAAPSPPTAAVAVSTAAPLAAAEPTATAIPLAAAPFAAAFHRRRHPLCASAWPDGQ